MRSGVLWHLDYINKTNPRTLRICPRRRLKYAQGDKVLLMEYGKGFVDARGGVVILVNAKTEEDVWTYPDSPI